MRITHTESDQWSRGQYNVHKKWPYQLRLRAMTKKEFIKKLRALVMPFGGIGISEWRKVGEIKENDMDDRTIASKPIKEECGNCRFWRNYTVLTGCCRKHSPTLLTGEDMRAFGYSQPLSVWPPIGAEKWCGDWELKPDGTERI